MVSAAERENQKSFTNNKNVEESPVPAEKKRTGESPRVDDLNIFSILPTHCERFSRVFAPIFVSCELFNSFVSLLLSLWITKWYERDLWCGPLSSFSVEFFSLSTKRSSSTRNCDSVACDEGPFGSSPNTFQRDSISSDETRVCWFHLCSKGADDVGEQSSRARSHAAM